MTTPIHFFHANGFPSETYKDLLSNIEGDIHSPISILGKNICSVEEGSPSQVKTKSSWPKIPSSLGCRISTEVQISKFDIIFEENSVSAFY